MEMYTTPQPLSAYLDRKLTCDCGREHYAALQFVSIRAGAVEDLSGFLKGQGFTSAYLIADEITRKLAGEKCRALLEAAGIKAKLHCLKRMGFDEGTVGELLIHMPLDCDVCVAVGTGAINDMTRFFSHRLGRPFCTVATAAPMDGFASSIAAIQVDELKTTFEAQTPIAIVGDTDILTGAPYRMIAAGLGDLLGKYTCLCDWKLSRLINGEHYCDKVVALVEKCVDEVLASADKAKDRDPATLGGIMEGLVLAGVAMSLYGNSRPASGCEHHMSHYWEMMCEQRGQRPAPHGIQVGVGTVLVLRLVEALLARQVDFDAARAAARSYDPAAWEREIRRAYGGAAEGVIAMEAQAKKNDTAARLARIDVMEQHWDELCGLLRALPAADEVTALLRSLGAPCTPAEIEVDEATLRDTFLYCKEVRARYTILQLLWDLGVLEELAQQVTDGLKQA